MRRGLSRHARLGEAGGGLKGLRARADANAKVIHDWADETPWIENLAEDPATRSNTSVCLKIVDPAITSLSVDAQWAFVKDMVALIEKEGAAYDIATIATRLRAWRIWCGCTVQRPICGATPGSTGFEQAGRAARKGGVIFSLPSPGGGGSTRLKMSVGVG